MIRTDLYKKNLKYIKASIASSDQILSFSNGRVRNSETLNYSNFNPVLEGLFCEKIFGLAKKNACLCGKVLNSNVNLVCKICKVDVSSYKVRRYKIGHIKLNDYFINTLFYKSIPSYLSLILNISLANIENVLYNNYYLVLYPFKNLEFNQVLSFKEYFYYFKKYGNKFFALTGGDAIKYALDHFDLNYELQMIEYQMCKSRSFVTSKYKRNIKRYKIIKFFIDNNISVSKFILNVIPVLPPDLRPVVKLFDNKIAASDLNELYKRVIFKANRLKNIKFNCFSSIVLNNEKIILQDAINKLFDNKEIANEFAETSKKILKSISQNIKGKTGLFRQNLLGKRVDYSARSVIVSGPFLELNQCSIPKIMAFELFRPFIYNKLISLNYVNNLKLAKAEVDNKTDLALNMLKIILLNNLVLLNRAPTLHRLGMQAFTILLNDDNVVKLHPLVCSAFNADFDGDQMAVHIPVSIKSRNEFKILLLSSNNILLPSSGEVSISPTQDIILGIYYATNLIKNIKKLYYFDGIYDMQAAFDFNLIKLNSRIFYRLKNYHNINNQFIADYNIYETTFGRALIYSILPKGFSYDFINKIIRKRDINFIFNTIFYKFGSNVIAKFSNELMKLGFSFATKSGISISIDDMLVYENKYELIEKTRSLIMSYNIDHLNGLLSYFNKKKKIIDIWELTFDVIFNFTIETFLNLPKNHLNSLYTIIDSGARGSELQIKQICCTRGLMVYKNLGLLEIPVLSNLREGLTVLEYFYFSHSSRKTLADTALKTSSAGYLTRKLVESSNDITTVKYDCKAKKGLVYKNLIYKGNVIEDFYERIFGKVLLTDIYDSKKNLIFKKNTLLLKEHVTILKTVKDISMLNLRSVITCKSKKGVCCLCYGLDLSKGHLVYPGEAVGIIAAQSIGEPGTQLTMRTFHTGGALSKKEIISSLFSNTAGYIKYSKSLIYVLNQDNERVVVSSVGKIFIKDKFGNKLESFSIPYSSILLKKNNKYVLSGEILCEWDGYNKLIISDRKGFVKFNNLVENLNYIKRFDSSTGKFIYEISHNYNTKSNLSLKICDSYSNCDFPGSFSEFNLIAGGFLYFFDNDYIKKGDIIFKLPLGLNSAIDIVGGLPRVADLFEARVNKNCSIISPISGRVNFYCKKKFKYLLVYNEFRDQTFKKGFALNKAFLVNEGSRVNKGDLLVDGELNPHDVLNVHGVKGLVEFLLSEIKSIYYSQGVKINDKHIEIIIKKMLCKAMIIDKGDSNFILGDIVDKSDIVKLNKKYKKQNKAIIKYKIVLSGITKASLNTKSFLGSASFQQTNSILSRAALFNEVDNLNTMKNNIMLGRVISVGTGYYYKIYKRNEIIY